MSTTPLPPLYARWVDEALGAPLPAEHRAPCDDCAMCGAAAARDGTPPEMRFEPAVKCCTFFPMLPNFAVGRILADLSPELREGRSRVALRVHERLSATPLGLDAAPAWAERYAASLERGGFGSDAALACPYLDPRDGGGCSIWRHREAVCATYFCKHADGARGARAWRAVKRLLVVIQWAVAERCLLDLGLDRAAVAELYRPEGDARRASKRELRGYVADDGALSPALARRVWGRWHGREEEFYLACAARVEALDWDGVRAIAGVRADLAAEQARAVTTDDRRLIPARSLVRGSFEAAPADDGAVQLRGELACFEPLLVTAEVYNALARFDGRGGADLEASTLEALTRRGILVEPDGRDATPIEQTAGPLQPDDRLQVFRGYRDAETSVVESEAGHAVTFHCGCNELTFHDAALLDFARHLQRMRNGFRAGDATAWGVDGTRLPWEQVCAVLETLLAERVLQWVPTTPDGPGNPELRKLRAREAPL